MMTHTQVKFSLYGLYQGLRPQVGGDPDLLVDALVRAVPQQFLRDALRTTIRNWVLVQLNRERRSGTTPTLPMVPTASTLKQGRTVSAKQQQRKYARWDEICSTMVRTATGYVEFGDCTYDDLLFAADDRQRHADLNQQQADRFRTYAALVKKHKVKKTHDLPATARAQIEKDFS